MAEIDTKSYDYKVDDPLAKAKQFGDLEQQNIAISQAKLKQMNDQFALMNQELSGLADPEGNNGKPFTKDQARERLLNFAKTYGFKPEVTQHMIGELDASPNVPTFARKSMIRGMDTNQRINNLYRIPGMYSNGQTDQPTATSPMLNGGAPVATGAPIQRQLPPTTPVVDETGQPRLQGPTPAVTPPGTVAGPQGGLPFPVSRPVPTETIRKPMGDTGTTINKTPNDVVGDRFPGPNGPASGQSPLFAQGLAEYTKDQTEAGNRALAIKNLIQAYPLISSKGFLSGPGTEAFTKGAAALKTWGFLDIDEKSDPTAIRQEVNKKLANYISSSPIGQRSDAAQALKEAASPSAKVQILPALKQLVKDAVALERVQIAMPNAFEGQSYQNYIKHKGTFPQSVDEKAFNLDMQEDGGKSIVDEMSKRLAKNKNDSQALKFFRSLEIADKQRMYK